jgi:hypothetical protein
MAFEIKIEISAEPALLSVLNTLAAGIAKGSVTEGVPQSVTQTPQIEVPKTTISKSELPQKAQTEEPKKDPNATIDSEFLPSIRSTVASYCELKGKDDGKAAVKKWLTDRDIGGLSKMTFGQADEFCAWLESEIEVLKNAG